MTDDDLQRERLMSYFAGYEAGKADAAKEAGVVLTEEDYRMFQRCQYILRRHGYELQYEELNQFLARSAQRKGDAE